MRAHVDNFRDKITDYILKLLNDSKNLSLADINKGILSCTKGYQLYSPTLDYLVRRAIGNGYVASVNLGGVEVFNLTQAGADYYKSVSVIWLNTYAVEQSLHLGNTRFADEANADTEFILHQEPDGTISIELAINRPPQYVAPSSLEQIGVFEDYRYSSDSETKARAKAMLFGDLPPAKPREKKKDSPLPLLEAIETSSTVVEAPTVEEDEDIEEIIEDYSSPIVVEEIKTAEAPKSPLESFLSSIDTTDPYKTKLADIFAETFAPVEKKEVVVETPAPSKSPVASFSDLKLMLQKEGYELNPYSRQSAINYFNMNFYFSGKLLRDTLTLGYLFSLLSILACYFIFNPIKPMGYMPYLIAAVVMLVFPIVGWIHFLLKPDRRKKADHTFKITFAGLLMVYIDLAVVVTLIGFVFLHVNVADYSSMFYPILYPCILLLYLPVCGIIYGLLYKNKKYFLK